MSFEWENINVELLPDKYCYKGSTYVSKTHVGRNMFKPTAEDLHKLIYNRIMTSTFTATTKNTEENRLKMCEFINKYSPLCTQITLRLVAGSIIIEGVRTATMKEIDAMCKQVPARTVIWNGDPVLGTVIIHNVEPKPNNYVWELAEIHSKSVNPKRHSGKNVGLMTKEEKEKMIEYIKIEIAKKIVEENPYLTDEQRQAIENFKTNK